MMATVAHGVRLYGTIHVYGTGYEMGTGLGTIRNLHKLQIGNRPGNAQ